MKVSLPWLKRYIDLDETPRAIEEALTLIGFEVEGVEQRGLPPLEKVVVGEILSRQQHPTADRLSVCEVQTSLEREPQTIVCGAENFKVGDRVPVALPGAVLPGGFKIKKSKLRGVVSHGMMCSAQELGLGEERTGLLILEGHPPIATPINALFPDGDTVFDIEVTPNRSDCLSHLGIARELAAFFGLSFAYPETRIDSNMPFRGSTAASLIDKVRVDTPENCPHYRVYSIHGVKIASSPAWMQRLLQSIGLRPINNIVDATNFVLHELGQPLHAFDAAKIRSRTLIVRPARSREAIVTLDGKARSLNPSKVVIADAERPLAIAGLMGSVDAEVDDATTDIVLEAAYFNPSNIRQTSRHLALSTDSSYRFERGVDPYGVEYAAWRAIDLILETAAGELLGPPLVQGSFPLEGREIEITPSFVRRHLGFDVEDRKILKIFNALQFDVSLHENDSGAPLWQVGIPGFRLDLERPIDLVEEFLRLYGTDKIPSAPVLAPALVHKDDSISVFKTEAAAYLVDQHFHECINYTLRSAGELVQWDSHAAAGSLGLANPLANDQSHLRSSLVPGLLDNLKLNLYRDNTPTCLFEIGSVFREREDRVWELISVAFVLVQSPQPESWLTREKPDFYTAANLLSQLFRLVGMVTENVSYLPMKDKNSWQEGHAAHFGDFTEGYEGQVGLISLPMLRKWDITGTVLAGTLDLSPSFLRKPPRRKAYKAFSQYPLAKKDLALVVDKTVLAEQVRTDLENAARAAAGQAFAIESVSIFDVYCGQGLPEDKKSLAFSITFRSHERTLTDIEVNKAFDAIQTIMEQGTAYTIRS